MLLIILLVVSGILCVYALLSGTEDKLKTKQLCWNVGWFLIIVCAAGTMFLLASRKTVDYGSYSVLQLESLSVSKTTISDIESVKIKVLPMETYGDGQTSKIMYSTDVQDAEVDTDSFHINYQKSDTGEKMIIKYVVKPDISKFEEFINFGFNFKRDTIYVIYK